MKWFFKYLRWEIGWWRGWRAPQWPRRFPRQRQLRRIREGRHERLNEDIDIRSTNPSSFPPSFWLYIYIRKKNFPLYYTNKYLVAILLLLDIITFSLVFHITISLRKVYCFVPFFYVLRKSKQEKKTFHSVYLLGAHSTIHFCASFKNTFLLSLLIFKTTLLRNSPYF